MHLPREAVRVVCHDTGGGIGARGAPIPECFFVAWCARRTGRAVKWTCDRTEGFVSDPHGRDNVSTAALALDAEGRILALRVDTIANPGAYPGGIGAMAPVDLGPRVQTGVYDISVFHARIRVAYTNTVNVFACRGAGQPEANYLIESLIDEAGQRPTMSRSRPGFPSSGAASRSGPTAWSSY